MIERNSKKRLGIFVFYDRDGIVDRYVAFLLEKMNEFLDDLVIVCNGKLKDRSKLEAYSGRVYTRPNIGFDAAAWQWAICDLITEEELSGYDELILFNDTYYGPIFPLEEMFGKMDASDCDFWGISTHSKSVDAMGTCELGYWPAHIQTYFLDIRKAMFTDPAFRKYWEDLPLCTSFEEAVGKNEVRFTNHFADLGYKWKVFVDMSDIDAREAVTQTHYMFDCYDMLVKYRCPFFKRKNFSFDRRLSLEFNNGTFVPKALEYIKNETDYDETLIFDNLLRFADISEVIECLGLYTLIDSGLKSELKPEFAPGKISGADSVTEAEITDSGSSAAVFAYLHDPYYYETYIKYLRDVPEYITIYIGTDSHAKAELIGEQLKEIPNRFEIRVLNSSGNGLGALLIGFKAEVLNTKYFCFVHDNIRRTQEYFTNNLTASYDMWDMVLRDSGCIETIIRKFEEDRYLGCLVPMLPLNGQFFHLFTMPWGTGLERVLSLLDELGSNRTLSSSGRPVSYGNIYWCRTEAVKNLISYEWDYDDFEHEDPSEVDSSLEAVIGKIIPYVAQGNGYFTNICLNKDIAVNSLINEKNVIRSITDILMKGRTGPYILSYLRFLDEITPKVETAADASDTADAISSKEETVYEPGDIIPVSRGDITIRSLRLKQSDEDNISNAGITYAIESTVQKEDFVELSGYAFLLRDDFRDYKPFILMVSESGGITKFPARIIRRFDIAAKNPDIPFLYNSGFSCRCYIDDLEKCHTYTAYLRMKNEKNELDYMDVDLKLSFTV